MSGGSRAIFRQKIRRSFCGLLFLIGFFAIGAWSTPAFAQACHVANMFNVGGTDPMGAAPCATNNIFGNILCYFKRDVGQVVGSLYCTMEQQLEQPLAIAITIVLIVFGIRIATGLSHASPKEAMATLLKIALVWTFATYGEWGIGIAYKFFMTVAEEGSNMVLGVLNHGQSGGVGLTRPMTLLTHMFTMGNDTDFANGGTTVDTVLHAMPPYCRQQFLTVFGFLLFFAPPLGVMLSLLAVQYLGLFARALLGYLTALVLISLLFILAPIFLSFALFQGTRPMFEQWIKYLTTFTIQMIIVFAFLAFLQLVPLIDAFLQLAKLLREYDDTTVKVIFNHPFHLCSICEYVINAPSQLRGTGSISCISNKAIPLFNLLKHPDFLMFAVSQVVALWVIGRVLSDFGKQIPEFAKTLGGLPFAASLMGTGAGAGGPGITYMGMEAAESASAGFRAGFSRSYSLNPFVDWPRRISGGLTGGVRGLLYGADDVSTPRGQLIADRVAQADDQLAQARRALDEVRATKETNSELFAKAQTDFDRFPTEAAQTKLRKALGDFTQAKITENAREQDVLAALRERAYYETLRQPTRGLLGSYNADLGTYTPGSLGSMIPHARDEEIEQELTQAAQRNQQKALYGKVLTPREASDPQTPLGGVQLPGKSRQDDAQSMLNDFQRQVAAARSTLSPDAAKEMETALQNARASYNSAMSEQGYAQVIETLGQYQRKLLTML